MDHIETIEITSPGTEFDEVKFKKTFDKVTALLSEAHLSPLEITYLTANLCITVGKSISLTDNKDFTHDDWVQNPSLDKATIIAGRFIINVHEAINHALQHGRWPDFDFYNYFGDKKNG